MSGAGPRGGAVLAGVCIAGPTLATLIPMAAAPAMPSMAARFAEGGDGQLFAQLVMTVPAIMLILAAPVAGLIAGRIGRRPTLLASLVLYGIGGVGVLFVDSRVPLIALRLLLGVAGGGLLTSSLALVGEHFEDRARETVLGFAAASASLFAAAALMFGGALVDAGGWRAPFALYLLCVPVLVVAWIIVRPGEAPIRDDLVHEERHIRLLLPMAPYYLLLVLLTIGMYTPAIQGPFLLESRGLVSAKLQGSIIAATGIVGMVTAALYGWLRGWIGVHGFLMINALSMGVGVLILALAGGTAASVAGCASVGIGAGMCEPAMASLIFDRTQPRVHALAVGLIVSALNIGQFVNALAMASVRAFLGITGSFVGLGALLCAAGIVVMVRGRKDLLTRRQP